MPDVSLSGISFKISGSTDSASNSIDSLISKLSQLKTALNASSSVKSLSTSIKSLKTSTAKVLPGISNFISSLKRIAYYRFIRTIIKSITSAFSEGMTNAYQFSKVVGYDLADALDTLTTKSFTMKNQLGAAFGALITALEPILLQIISLVTRAANVITRFIALLSGKDTYLKATDSAQEYASAVGAVGDAAEEAMHYLAPFDELNVLSDNSSGSSSGSSSSTDYTDMFEETPVMQNLSDFEASLALSFNDVLFDWDDLTGEQIAEKVLAGLFTLTGAGVGFILGGVPGAIVGSLIGLTLGLIADSIIFDHDGVLDPEEIRQSLKYVVNALVGGVFGLFLGGPAGAFFGASLSLGITLLVDSLFPEAGGSSDSFLTHLKDALNNMVDSQVLGFTLGGASGQGIQMALNLGMKLTLQGSIGEWIVEHIFQPIINKYNEFVQNHPTIAGLLGLEEVGSTSPTSHSTTTHYNVEVDANITSATDSIPSSDKVSMDWGINVDDWTDSVPTSKRKVSNVKADVNDITNSIPSSKNGIDMYANLFSWRKTGDFKSNTSDSWTGVGLYANLFSWRKTGDFKSNTSDSWTGVPLFANLFSWRKTGDLKSNTSTGWTGLDLWANLFNWRETWKTGTPKVEVDAHAQSLEFDDDTTVGGSIHFGYNGGGRALGGSFFGGLWHDIPQFASGGRPHGSLFLAGEAGAEIVGHVGGRTEVLNRSQLASTMYAAVKSAIASVGFHVSPVMPSASDTSGSMSEEMMYRAMLRALNDSDAFPDEIDLDGEVVYRQMVRRNKLATAMSGLNPMMATG